jgi:hypothetical protein
MRKLHGYNSTLKLTKGMGILLFVLVTILWLPSLTSSSAATTSKVLIAPPRVVRAAFQLGGGGREYTCPIGAPCPRQTLSCPEGWEARPSETNSCCARCCQGNNCGAQDCCSTEEGGGGHGGFLP